MSQKTTAASGARCQPTSPGDLLSIVTPAFRESGNLPDLYRRLEATLAPLGLAWEWVIVDDHSPDDTFEVIKELARHDSRVRGLRLARNAGSHLALCCGLEFARGNCAVALAGDCQDPPESIPQLIDEWRAGAQVVWAARAGRPGETRFTLLFSRIYYFVMRRFVGFSDMPSTGADFFLLDRRVIDEIREFKETHVNILALIGWMGFRQSTIAYTKEERAQGESGWTLTKKLKLLVDSVTAFTYRPVRLMSYLGGMVTMAGLSYAVALLVSGQREASVAGWEVLIVIALVLGGLQMVMLGILGEYLWRALEESRRRPRFMIEDATERIGRSAEVATDA